VVLNTGIQAGWSTPVIPALGILRQENHEFEASLGYTERFCLKNQINKQTNKNLDLPLTKVRTVQELWVLNKCSLELNCHVTCFLFFIFLVVLDLNPGL
jgi:hypothetical protein